MFDAFRGFEGILNLVCWIKSVLNEGHTSNFSISFRIICIHWGRLEQPRFRKTLALERPRTREMLSSGWDISLASPAIPMKVLSVSFQHKRPLCTRQQRGLLELSWEALRLMLSVTSDGGHLVDHLVFSLFIEQSGTSLVSSDIRLNSPPYF